MLSTDQISAFRDFIMAEARKLGFNGFVAVFVNDECYATIRMGDPSQQDCLNFLETSVNIATDMMGGVQVLHKTGFSDGAGNDVLFECQ
jgi:hypothetical protein